MLLQPWKAHHYKKQQTHHPYAIFSWKFPPGVCRQKLILCQLFSRSGSGRDSGTRDRQSWSNSQLWMRHLKLKPGFDPSLGDWREGGEVSLGLQPDLSFPWRRLDDLGQHQRHDQAQRQDKDHLLLRQQRGPRRDKSGDAHRHCPLWVCF